MNSFKLLSRVFTVCCISIGLALVCLVVRLAVHDSTAFPFWDQWVFTMQIASQDGHYFLSQLWEQHNEHRIVLLRLLLLADFHWFRATGRLLLSLILVFHLLHLMIFCRVVFWLKEIGNTLRLALCGLVAAYLFSLGQLENFVCAWQLCFILASFFASLSFYLFVASLDASVGLIRATVKPGLFVWSLVAALLATLSVASGLFVWPVLIYLCFAMRLDRRILAMAVVAGTVVMGSYFINYHSPAEHANPLASLHHPLQMLQYLVLYLGAAWEPFGTTTILIVGSVGLLIGILVLWNTTFRTASISRAELFCSAIVALTLITGLVTASGRINFGIDQALSSRYQTFAMVFWSALGLWAVSIASNNTGREWRCLVVALVSLIVVSGPLLKFQVVAEPFDARATKWRQAEVSVLSDVDDHAAMKSVSPDQSQTDPALDYLRLHHLSVFADDRYAQLGSLFSTFYHVSKEVACVGGAKLLADASDISSGGAELSGWAWDADTESAFQSIVLVDAQGKIYGFGAGGFRFSGQAFDNMTDKNLQWFGYVKKGPATTRVQAYAVRNGKEACPIGAPQAVPPAPVESSSSSARLLPNSRLRDAR
jgi:hypothetical protein